MKQIKLEVGKTYRNRKGEEVKIVERIGGGPYQFKGSNGECYTERGIWRYFGNEDLEDLIEEVTSETRHTFDIPEGVKQITLDYFGNRIVVEMVQEKEPKPGDVMVNTNGSVYIFKSVKDGGGHNHFAWLGASGNLRIAEWCFSGHPATPEEAQLLFDALKKAGKRWNPETMQVEEIPEIDRIREWVERHLEDGYYNQEGIAEVIGHYLKHKEDKK